jgi:hypothetical protein
MFSLKIKKFVKKGISLFILPKYHRIHKEKALQILQSIEKQKGKTNPLFLKYAKEYSIDVLGWSGYSPWLFVYSAIAGEFKEGWIPDNYYGSIVVPKIKGSYGKAGDMNGLNQKLLSHDALPDLGYFINGIFFDNTYSIISEKNLEKVLFKMGEKIVFKVDNSNQGKGIYFFDRNSFSANSIRLIGNGVFQNFIKQHHFFEQFSKKSVATVRITSVIDQKGEASIRAAYIRFGQGNDTHVKSLSHIRVPLKTSTGELDEIGYLPNWQHINSHPDFKIAFRGKQVPFFRQFEKTALELHQKIPFVRSVGWDMIMDENEQVKVMEWNGAHNDIKFSEATNGPCFKDLGWEKLWSDGV